MSDYNTEVIKDVGIFSLKTLITLNSGSALAILAFIANIQSAGEASAVVHMDDIKIAMRLFLFGISMAMLSAAVTYLSAQIPESDTRFNRWLRLALMVSPAVASFIGFALGFNSAVSALKNAC